MKRYDLINNLIADIKKDPYGRRKVVSLWQEQDLHETPGLAPCAFLTMWNVRGQYLDMSMIQRSGDMLTASGAGGINEIQYAALLMMIACVTGLEPGVFTHFVANEQIYDRHIDNAHEMLRRAEGLERQEAAQIKGSVTSQLMDADSAQAGGSISAPPENTEDFSSGRQPSLLLHKKKGCRFEDITIDDFEMRDYTPMKPQLKFELGI